ncbi:GDP-L-fucose synthase family protein [Flavobacterium suncheonense]|uniref:GDP-L-fucose synthase n=1 Tax=Flavobacterium suncheonense GH29-5 = DSM 17707 TaxID=1121899 RepID=A0A0A2MAW2_9FLAO|nr:GDP-L-fucose synthase [Flavobacterium suncheonense]KGO89409.1 GDP-4-keto-6-deoxy-D-mannose-3, 5-epimerase-4-reductase [Flavobacterium suncheonense GH29-5 = DSM 17707]
MHKHSKIYVAGHRGLVGSAIKKNLETKGFTNIVVRTHAELDLTDAKATADFFESEKPEYVFLAAAKVGGIIANNTYRADFIYDNLMIQNNVIHQSYVHGVKKLLFLGSTCIYPKNAPQPLIEDYLLTGSLEYTNEPYAIAKIAGIKTCESYNLQYGTNFMSVMPTNLYGPNDNFDLEKSHVLPALIRKVHLGKALENSDWETLREDLNCLPIKGVNGTASQTAILEVLQSFGIAQTDTGAAVEIWGSGKPMREFLWSEDMADACVFLMENRNFSDCVTNHSEVRNTHINIGTGQDITIADLAELVKTTVGFNGNFVFNTAKPDGTMRKLTDVSKLNSMGWKHQVEITEGVQRMYDWYKLRK